MWDYEGSGINGVGSGIRRMGSGITAPGSGITSHGIGISHFSRIFVKSKTKTLQAFEIKDQKVGCKNGIKLNRKICVEREPIFL